MAEIWEKTRLSYFKSQGAEYKVVEITKNLKAIKKAIEDYRWRNNYTGLSLEK